MLLSEYNQSAVKLAGAALTEIASIQNDRKSIAPQAGVLYHYTTADGLKGIIEKNELWATSAYFLSDSAEMIYGYGLVKEVLDNWIVQNPRPEDSQSLGLARILRKAFGEDLLNRNVIRPIYLTCFCEDDNLLSQWRAYGQSGGYSLGFNVPADDRFTGHGFKPEPNTYTSKWTKVEYERNEQTKKCRTIVDTVLAIFDDPDTARAMVTVGDHPFFGYERILRVISDTFVEEIAGFKNEAFKVEKEWRVVVRQREFKKQGTDDGGKTPTPVHFRSSEGVLVPYVKLIPLKPTDKLPIACIRSGPTHDKTTAGMAVKMLLDKSGFSNVRVAGSDIPVRFQRV